MLYKVIKKSCQTLEDGEDDNNVDNGHDRLLDKLRLHIREAANKSRA